MALLLNESSNDSVDVEPSFSINKAYADKYDSWRQKEELQKLKDRYGDEEPDDDATDSSESESEDENAEELTAEVEKAWLKAYAAVKNRDPKIYSKDVNFFSSVAETSSKKDKKKPKSMFLKDYERKVLLERGGLISDDSSSENEKMIAKGPSYSEEQEQIKQSIKEVLSSDDDSDELLVRRRKTQREKEEEDDDYHEWLKGQKDDLDDKEAGEELGVLKNYWNKPDLDEGEKFLRDYILNKGYIDKESSRIPSYDEIVNDDQLSDDDEALERQETFETKYNFRFEEPDTEFIKSYPRTIKDSVRRKDDKRALKRTEVRDRKEMAKQRKREELKQLKNLKKKEILDKLAKIKEITGNTTVGFEAKDMEGDFDPTEYDRKMQAAFDDEFYQDGACDAEKPVFSDNDEYDEDGYYKDDGYQDDGILDTEPHCDDPDFVMDADYDPSAARDRKNKKNKKNKLLSKILEVEKPDFDPDEKTFEEYLDEYYKLDYDDMIGDQPCRFKYRKVIANDFGLTTAEILSCPDRELNSWVSLRKASQYRPDDEEFQDVRRFRARAKNHAKKLNILSSLRKPDKDEEAVRGAGVKKRKRVASASAGSEAALADMPQHLSPQLGEESDGKRVKIDKNLSAPLLAQNDSPKKRTKKNKSQTKSSIKTNGMSTAKPVTFNETENYATEKKNKKKERRNKEVGKLRKNKNKKKNFDLTDERLKAYGINPKKLPYMNLSHKRVSENS